MFDDLAAKCPESESEHHFPASYIGGIAERTVKPDASQRERRGREEREKDRAQAVFRKGVGETLFEWRKIVDRAVRLDFADLFTNGFGHGHGSIAGSNKEEGPGLRNGSAPIDRGYRRMIKTGIAGITGDANDCGWARVAKIVIQQVMADGPRTREVRICGGGV